MTELHWTGDDRATLFSRWQSYPEQEMTELPCTVGWVKFSEWKKQVMEVEKYVKDPKLTIF